MNRDIRTILFTCIFVSGISSFAAHATKEVKEPSTIQTQQAGPSVTGSATDKPDVSGMYGVDINRASAEELAEALNGVGLKKAQAIVRHRQESGPFKTPDQLLDVPGIGASLLERNRSRIKW